MEHLGSYNKDWDVPLDTAHQCVGPGWHPLVKQLISDLLVLGWNGRLAQVKEKFGGLRFYADDVPEAGEDLIRKAEGDSYHICEECGEPGKLRAKGWWKTRCANCQTEWVEKHQLEGKVW